MEGRKMPFGDKYPVPASRKSLHSMLSQRTDQGSSAKKSLLGKKIKIEEESEAYTEEDLYQKLKMFRERPLSKETEFSMMPEHIKKNISSSQREFLIDTEQNENDLSAFMTKEEDDTSELGLFEARNLDSWSTDFTGTSSRPPERKKTYTLTPNVDFQTQQEQEPIQTEFQQRNPGTARTGKGQLKSTAKHKPQTAHKPSVVKNLNQVNSGVNAQPKKQESQFNKPTIGSQPRPDSSNVVQFERVTPQPVKPINPSGTNRYITSQAIKKEEEPFTSVFQNPEPVPQIPRPVPPKPSKVQSQAAPTKKVSIFSRQSKYFMMICMIVGLLITGTGLAYAIKTFGLSDTGKLFGDMARLQAGDEIYKLELNKVGYDGKNPSSINKKMVLNWINTTVKPKVERPAKNAQLKGKKISDGMIKEQNGLQIDMRQLNQWLNNPSVIINQTKQVPLVTVKPKWTEQDYKEIDKKQISEVKKKLTTDGKNLEKLNGWVVDPGQTFSLTEALGEASKKEISVLSKALSAAVSEAKLKNNSKDKTEGEEVSSNSKFYFTNSYNKPIMLKLNVKKESLNLKILTAPGAVSSISKKKSDTNKDQFENTKKEEDNQSNASQENQGNNE
ncbi:hypothetical protein [Thermoflavimicrobium daqui]|uniref:Uncharacterized protein n=1 Tax=Thermoflavimicrobium daqui TaxID=2137476 RepID=A0A364K4Q3_9BACL|nr:hypothetical protein [Thermoflavimicrobium daqui]RAL24345.1 hypothetical protein DL897_08440 [Thermoflavimicrobium daqui]